MLLQALQQLAMNEVLMGTLVEVCELEQEQQLQVERSASSASALVCWVSALWRRNCWAVAVQSV